MKYYNLKDKEKFLLEGSIALDEEFNRFKKEDIELINKVNKEAAYLSKASAGIIAKFKTNAIKINIRANITNKFHLSNLTAISESGFDLYMYDENLKKYVFYNTTKFDIFKSNYDLELFSNDLKKERSYLLYFPLYAKVDMVEIGVNSDAFIKPRGRYDKNIIFYGTSITQGASASRPGLSFTNTISRELEIEVYNYGFSGQAFLEKEMAFVISRVDNPKLLFIDAEPNAGIDNRLIDNLGTFVLEFRKKHPSIPIIIASRITYSKDRIDNELKVRREKNNNFIIDYVNQNKDNQIYYFDGKQIFKENIYDMTIDGIHPNDLGMREIASCYKEVIKEFL